jgi:hypothetical protein
MIRRRNHATSGSWSISTAPRPSLKDANIFMFEGKRFKEQNGGLGIATNIAKLPDFLFSTTEAASRALLCYAAGRVRRWGHIPPEALMATRAMRRRAHHEWPHGNAPTIRGHCPARWSFPA